jgi:serine/threonine protein kinase
MASMASAGGGTRATHILDQKPTLDLRDELESELFKMKEGKRSNGQKRWRLDEYLGGKQGETAVFSAMDARGGQVALKFMCAEDDDVKRRFKRECAMQAQFTHPNIVRCIKDEPLINSDGSLMVAILEYLPKKTVDHYLQQLDGSSTGERFVVNMAVDVLHGLEHVHGKGIIHKDIKCPNILSGSNGFKIADFGIAAMDESAKMKVSDTMNTLQIRTVGTPHYMSLEQLMGGEISFPADLYSLGVVMYRCLSGGKYPFGNEDSTFQEMLLGIATSASPPILSGVSDQLSAIITKALQKQIADRYSTATDMLKDLKPLSQQGQPLPPGCEYHFFICKHEARAKDSTMVIYYELRARGYKVWISNEVEKPNKEEMINAVKKSAVFLIFLTHGIFTRYWCRDVEIRTAMEERKPFILLTCKHGGHKFGDRKQECSSKSTTDWFGLDTVVPIEFEPVANELCTKITRLEWSLNITDRPGKLDYLEREFMGREETARDFYRESSVVDAWLETAIGSSGGGGGGGGGSRSSRSSSSTTNSSGETKGSSSSNSTITKKKHKHVVKGIDWLPPSERDEAIPLKENIQQLQDLLVRTSKWTDDQRNSVEQHIKYAKTFLDECKRKTVNDLDTLKHVRLKLETKYVATYKAVSDLLKDEAAWSDILKLGQLNESENDTTFCQSRNGLIAMYEDAVLIQPTFDRIFTEIASECNGTFTSVTPKRMFRALEKTVMKPPNDMNLNRADNVCDVIRGMLVFFNFEDMCQGIELMKSHKDIVVMRTKDRFSNPTSGGWMDHVNNVRFKSDRNRHVCEIQFVHKSLLVVREALGGHHVYNYFRSAMELLESHGALGMEGGVSGTSNVESVKETTVIQKGVSLLKEIFSMWSLK